MLYQTIIEQGEEQRLLAGDSRAITKAIDKAGRFVFDELASRTLAQLALTKPSRILLGKEFLRPPFDPLWIEYRDEERKKLWRERGGEVRTDHQQPISTGILLWSNKDDPAIVHIWSAWDLASRPGDPLAEPFHFSPLSISLDLSFERADEDRVQDVVDQIYAQPDIMFARHSHLYLVRTQREEVESYARILANTEVESCPLISETTMAKMLFGLGPGQEAAVREIMHRWREDVTQEIPFVIAALLLLNCRNGVSQERVEYEKLNKRRIKRGKAPIREHTVIRLRVPRGSMGTGSGSYEKRSAHWVMGHPKVRKTGVFWWSPHIRGEGREDATGTAPRTRLVKG